MASPLFRIRMTRSSILDRKSICSFLNRGSIGRAGIKPASPILSKIPVLCWGAEDGAGQPGKVVGALTPASTIPVPRGTGTHARELIDPEPLVDAPSELWDNPRNSIKALMGASRAARLSASLDRVQARSGSGPKIIPELQTEIRWRVAGRGEYGRRTRPPLSWTPIFTDRAERPHVREAEWYHVSPGSRLCSETGAFVFR
jgi:hypothetical protein